MASTLTFHKVVGSLPSTLAPNALYSVRVGAGFDLYLTNSTGTIVATKVNQPSVPIVVSDQDPGAATVPTLWVKLSTTTPGDCSLVLRLP